MMHTQTQQPKADSASGSKSAQHSPFNVSALMSGANPSDPAKYYKAHAEKLAEALKGWQDWSEGKRAWPKLETNAALADWEAAQ